MIDKQDRSLGELISELANDVSFLVRQEIALAKLEIGQTVSHVGRNVGYLVAGGAVLYAAFLTLLAAAAISLANIMPWWAATLLIAIIVAIVGGVLVSKGLAALRKTNLAPQQTIETLKEDAAWAKQQVK